MLPLPQLLLLLLFILQLPRTPMQAAVPTRTTTGITIALGKGTPASGPLLQLMEPAFFSSISPIQTN